MSGFVWPEGTEQVLIEALREARRIPESLREPTPDEVASIVLVALGEIVQRDFVSREAVREAEAVMTGKANVVARTWKEDTESVLVLRACAQVVHDVLEPPVPSAQESGVIQWLQEQGYIDKGAV